MDRPPSTPSEDLFQASLTAADDVASFDRPWNPTTLVLLAFFFGLPTGGGLLALNFRKLGLPRQTWPAFVVVTVVTLVVIGISAWLFGSGTVDRREFGQRQIVRLAGRGINVVSALVLASGQRRRFRLYQMGDIPTGPLVVPALAAILIGVSATFALSWLWTAAIGT